MYRRQRSHNWADFQPTAGAIVAQFMTKYPILRARMEWGDLIGELAVVWARCLETYDPARGVKFTTMFWSAACRKLIDLVRENQRKSKKVLVGFSAQKHGDDAGEFEPEAPCSAAVLERPLPEYLLPSSGGSKRIVSDAIRHWFQTYAFSPA